MVQLFRLLGIEINYLFGDSYPKRTLLHGINQENGIIMREETSEYSVNSGDCRYSFYKNGRLLSYIVGRHIEQNKFYIDRIENLTRKSQYKIPGSRTIPYILTEMEFDLQKQGIEYLTTDCLAWIAPIAIQKYGFQEQNGKTLEELEGSLLQLLPWKAVKLEKRLGNI